MKTMSPIIAAAGICFVVGCQKTPQLPETPKLSEIFKAQLIQYLKDAGKLSSQSGDGINYLTLNSQRIEAKSTFDLLDKTWPSGFCPEARDSFKKSNEGYELASELWNSKINKADSPTEPNINGWARYQGYAGNSLVVEAYDSDFLVEQYRGKRYLPFDKNISVLLTFCTFPDLLTLRGSTS